ncbi:hypothetical protein [Methanocella arvoryzae]|uniref:Uncharacterized protein n=1 Tax=Methanocella arvoryzae (strain DSM 22066 / NBRC 105507 / MRE50) TaxID=351160 RepID=Q0W916_METAR|nr:hypothetical protein [Methanocella arvoryzae]CAJ35110.1 hypothetical protein LRC84 [Methanocella arvoryzae MRE50]
MFTTPVSRPFIDTLKALGLPEKKENNIYLVLHVHGDGIRAPKGWNAKIFRNSKNELKLVTTDEAILNRLLKGGPGVAKKEDAPRATPIVTPPLPKHTASTALTDFGMEDCKQPEAQLVIKVDDSGWGFPLGGVMIGATDGSRVETGIIELKYFQEGLFESKEYLDEAAHITVELINKLGATKDNSRVEICPGYINSKSYTAIKYRGYSVEKKEITGLLQDELEKRFFEYVKGLGYESYYDPKQTKSIGKNFNEVIAWIDKDRAERMKLAKSGWKYFKR